MKDSKKLGQTKIKTIDLHGYTVHFSWMRLKSELEEAKDQGYKNVKVIYGHGKIKQEVMSWAEALPLQNIVTQFDGGAFTARLK
jgi:DNA-nicking Smr family endonuclease